MTRLKNLSATIPVAPLNDIERKTLSKVLHLVQWLMVSVIAFATITI